MNKGHEIKVLDKGYVRLVDWYGSDKRIVEAARVSYCSPSKGDTQDKKLLKYLWRNKHTSPFEQCCLTLDIKLPLFVQGQLVRHRTFRLNQQSARYTEMPDEFYFPDSWRKQDAKNKQGSIESPDQGGWNPQIGDHTLTRNMLEFNATKALKFACAKCHKLYAEMIEAGVAKEMARMILPQNLYTEIYLNCDIHNLMHFFRLRMDVHAQWEIRQYANAMFEIFEQLFPWCAEAFTEESKAETP